MDGMRADLKPASNSMPLGGLSASLSHHGLKWMACVLTCNLHTCILTACRLGVALTLYLSLHCSLTMV
jgi:hypothetical protein